MEASRPRSTHSYTLRGRTARKNPTQEKTVIGGPVPDGPRSLTRGPSWPLPRIKGPPSTGREMWPLDLSQLRLKYPKKAPGTYPRIFNSSIEVLVGYRQWRRSNLGPGLFPGQRSFHKLQGPSRGPGSRGRVASRPRQALPHSASAGGGCKPRGRP